MLHRSNRAKNFLKKDRNKHQVTFVASVRYWRIYPYVWVYSFIRSFISDLHGKVCRILPVYSYVHKCNALSHVVHLRRILLTRPSRQAMQYKFKTRTDLHELNEDEKFAQCQNNLYLKNLYRYDRCKPQFVSRLRKPVLLFEVAFAFGPL